MAQGVGDDREFVWHRHPVFVGLLSVVVGAVLAFAGTVIASRQGKLEAIVPRPTVTVTSTAPGPTVSTTTTETVTAEPTGSSTDSPGTSGIGDPAGESLADIEPINGGLRTGAVVIHGQPFGTALYQGIGGCVSKLTTTWNLGRKYERFDAVIGLRDESRDRTLKVQFTAYVTDGTRTTASKPIALAKYQSQPLRVALNQADELRLEAVAVTTDRDLCTNAGYAAWANPRLYTG
jgi:hypothetical protein